MPDPLREWRSCYWGQRHPRRYLPYSESVCWADAQPVGGRLNSLNGTGTTVGVGNRDKQSSHAAERGVLSTAIRGDGGRKGRLPPVLIVATTAAPASHPQRAHGSAMVDLTQRCKNFAASVVCVRTAEVNCSPRSIKSGDKQHLLLKKRQCWAKWNALSGRFHDRTDRRPQWQRSGTA